MRKIIISLIIAFMLLPLMAQATSDKEALIESLRVQILALQTQILELQGQLLSVKEATQEIKSTLKLARHLEQGMRGEDVKVLQEVLATDPEIYPEGLVTGYLGPLTFGAVKKFQKKMGVEQVGRVGPKTVSKINELLEEGAGSSGKVPPGLLIAPGIRKKIGYTPKVPSGQKLPPGIAKKLDGATSSDPGDATTTPDIVAPVISDLTATSTSATGTNIIWTTDEEADSVAWYATSSPVVVSTSTQSLSSSALETSHDLPLSGLTASTTYYYLVTSADSSENRATSIEGSFTTLAE